MKIINFPIETFEERYSAQWNKWFPREFDRLNINYITIHPQPLTNIIRNGEFLDCIGTNYFKSLQLSNFLKLVDENKIKNGDVLFFHDLWYPGLEAFSYIKEGLGLDIKIMGIFHAGTWDAWDWTTQRGMGKWAEYIEKGWMEIADKIFVATKYHKDLILEKRGDKYKNKIFVTGLPYYMDDIIEGEKEDIIVFPHRLNIEKQVDEFERLKDKVEDIIGDKFKWLITKKECKTKKEYYQILGKAKYSISFALQETWGIAMWESVLSNCIPLVPDKLSYSELYFNDFKYFNFNDLIGKLCDLILKNKNYDNKLLELKENFKIRGESAIENIVRKIYE